MIHDRYVHALIPRRTIDLARGVVDGAISSRAAKHQAPLAGVIGTIVVAGLLLYPMIVVVRDGVSLTGSQEESVGYRYFYSLRLLYGTDEHPWLPQGQAIGLIHIVLQALLTAAGYPPTQLFPRIDVFGYVAIALPAIAACGAYVWAQRAFDSSISKLILAAAVVGLFYDRRSGSFDVLTKPDYPAWVGAIALITLGWSVRLHRNEGRQPLNFRAVVLLGLFAGVCLSVKPTYGTFPLAIALAMIAPRIAPMVDPVIRRARGDRNARFSDSWPTPGVIAARVGWLFSAALATIVTFLGLTVAYYLGNVGVAINQFGQTAGFIRAVGTSSSFPQWLREVVTAPPDLVTLSTLLPVLLLLGALVSARSTALALLPSAALATWFIYQRFTTTTLLEANAYLLVAGGAWVTASVRSLGGSLGRLRRLVSGIGLVVLALTTARSVATFSANDLAIYRFNDQQARRWEQLVAATPGATLFLIPGNEWRFLTVDTAIFKGGSGISHGAGWGTSPLLRSMFPDRWYLRPDAVQAHGAPPFSKVAFVRDRGEAGMAEATERIRTTFGLSIQGQDCAPGVLMSNGAEMVLCHWMAQPIGKPLATDAAELSARLEVPVEAVPGNPDQFLIRAPEGSADLGRIGRIDTDYGYAVGLTLPGGQPIGFRYVPQPTTTANDERAGRAAELSARLGVVVEPIPDETDQFLIVAPEGSVDLSRLGTINTDLGYSVGVTLPDGQPIGFRYAVAPDATTRR